MSGKPSQSGEPCDVSDDEPPCLEDSSSEEDSLEPIPPKKKQRRTLQRDAIGCDRIDSYATNTYLGSLRVAGKVKSVPVTKGLFKKINEKVKITQSKKQKKPKTKAKKKAKKKKKQQTLAAFGFFKSKPRPGEN